MTFYWATALIAVAMAAARYLGVRLILRRALAKPLAHLLNAVRGIAIIIWLAAAPMALPAGLLIWSEVVIVSALLLIPYQWLIVISGGREPKGELRHVAWKAAVLYDKKLNQYPPPPRDIDRMRRLIQQMERARSPETSEFCDLQVAECRDWMAGACWILAQGWRAIRSHEIEQQLYGGFARPAKLDHAEATFRWQLFRVFAWLTDTGDQEMDRESRVLLEQLLAELDEFRRPDTERFIDLVKESATVWLSSEPRTGPWMPASGLVGLGPAINAEYARLWPGCAVFHGAQLDERDQAYFSQPAVAAATLGRTGATSTATATGP